MLHSPLAYRKVQEIKSFKHRWNTIFKKPKFVFGDTLCFFKHEGRFEPIYFPVIRKFLKRFLKRRRKKIRTYFRVVKRLRRRRRAKFRAIWVMLVFNFPLTKKSKNSRMGKGKGLFVRWTSRYRGGQKFIEFNQISSYRIRHFFYILHYRIPVKFTVWTKRRQIALCASRFSNFKNFIWNF